MFSNERSSKFRLIYENYCVRDGQKDVESQVLVEFDGGVDGETLAAHMLNFSVACGYSESWFVPCMYQVAGDIMGADSEEVHSTDEQEFEEDIKYYEPIDVLKWYLDNGHTTSAEILSFLNEETEKVINSQETFAAIRGED